MSRRCTFSPRAQSHLTKDGAPGIAAQQQSSGEGVVELTCAIRRKTALGARIRTRILPMHVIQEREREVSQNKCVRKKFHLLICVRRGCERELCECARGEESRKIYVHHVLSSIYFIYFDMRTHTFFPAAAAYVPCAVCARVRIKINIGIKM